MNLRCVTDGLSDKPTKGITNRVAITRQIMSLIKIFSLWQSVSIYFSWVFSECIRSPTKTSSKMGGHKYNMLSLRMLWCLMNYNQGNCSANIGFDTGSPDTLITWHSRQWNICRVDTLDRQRDGETERWRVQQINWTERVAARRQGASPVDLRPRKKNCVKLRESKKLIQKCFFMYQIKQKVFVWSY